MPRTFRNIIQEAREMLQDISPPSDVTVTGTGGTRYTDVAMFQAINGFMQDVRTKRPDLFLPIGLRVPVPIYDPTADLDTPFPLDASVYNAFVYYVVGRCELREDPYSEDSRAVSMMNKALSNLLQVPS
jgi:hypothetical protein